MTVRTASPPRLRDLAETSAAALREDRRCLAVLLFGSAARRQDDEHSDLDLLVLHRGGVPEEALDLLDERVSVSFYNEDRWSRLRERSPLFAIHLAREGVALYDPQGKLNEALRSVEPLSEEEARGVAKLTRRRLRDILADPGFAPDDQISAGELYALAKQAAFLASAEKRHYVFDRHSAFDDLAETHRKLRPDLERVALLEGAWLAARPNLEQAWPCPVAVKNEMVRSAIRVIEKA